MVYFPRHEEWVEKPSSRIFFKFLESTELSMHLQQCTDDMISILKEPECLYFLIHYATEMPNEVLPDYVLYQYPFNSTEILCAGIEPIELALLCEEKTLVPRILLWSFLKNKAPLNSLLAGYFSRIFQTLLRNQCKLTCQFISRRRNANQLLTNHLYNRSIADLYKTLICLYHQEEFNIIPIHTLIKDLLNLVHKDLDFNNRPDMDMHLSITLIIRELIFLRGSLLFFPILLQQLISNSIIQKLLDMLCSDCNKCISLAAVLLVDIISSTCLGQSSTNSPSASHAVGTITHVQESPESNDHLSAEFHADNDPLALEDCDSPEIQGAHMKQVDLPMMQSDCNPWGVTLESGAFIEGPLLFQLPKMLVQLEKSLQSHESKSIGNEENIKPQWIELPNTKTKAIGIEYLDILSFIKTALRINSENIYQALISEGFVPVFINLLFEHPWNTVLHTSIADIMQILLMKANNSEILRILYTETQFFQKLIDFYRARQDKRYKDSLKPWHATPSASVETCGYSSHLLQIAQVIICRKLDLCDDGFCIPLDWEDIMVREIRYHERIWQMIGGPDQDVVTDMPTIGMVDDSDM